MNSLVNYLLESGISLAFLSLLYLLFLRKETYFQTNRLFLLMSVLFSLVLPLLHIPVFEPKSVMIEEVRVTPYSNLLETVVVRSQDFSQNVESVILSSTSIITVYALGAILFMALLAFRFLKLMQMIRRNPVLPAEGYKMVLIDQQTSPFAFMNYIFVRKDFDKTPGYHRMMIHELEHVRQGHTFDILILEILTIFQWFNPFMWMLRRAIRENHEYLADKAVLSSGIHPSEYKELLLSQVLGGPYYAASHFNYSMIRNRIRMMTRIQSPKAAAAKVLPGLLAAGALLLAFACEQRSSVSTSPVRTLSENTIAESISGNEEGSKEEENASLPGIFVVAQAKTSEDLNNVVSKETNPAQSQAASNADKETKVVFRGDTAIITGTPEDIRKLEKMFSSNLSVKSEPSSGSTVRLEVTNKIPMERKTQAEALPDEEQVFFIVEEMPEFPGGEAALRNFIAQTIKYPVAAQDLGIQGRVYVSFVVSKTGKVIDAKIARGVDPVLDKEALRVVNALPLWKEGMQRGKPVNVSYTVPINFALQ